MKRAVKKKDGDDGGARSVLRSVFRSFTKLAEQAGEGRPLLRGLRVAQDPKAERIVVVHGGTRVEFVLKLSADSTPPHAVVECRRMDTAGVTEPTPIASFQFDEAGIVSHSTVTEFIGEKITDANGAWSIVAAVIWDALQSPA
jgi:hypothetical protein